jgi:hypothetical protein
VRTTEAALTEGVSDALRKAGYTVFTEIPLMSRCIDVVAIGGHEDHILAIECKVHDWRRALIQAASHRLACDAVAVCMPERTPAPELVRKCEESGIGLFHFNDRAGGLEQVVRPKSVESNWTPARDWLMGALGSTREPSTSDGLP